MTEKSKVRVAALGDMHVREGDRGAYRDLMADICQNAEVLVLCGDLTNRGLPHEADVLAEELMSCKLPIVAVLGNHDYECGQHDEVRRIIAQAGVTVLDDEPCEISGVGFAGVRGFCGGFDRHMLTPFGEDMVKRFVHEAVEETLRLEGALAKLRTQHKVAVLHYAPIRQTVEGEPPEIFPFLGSSRLAEPIDRYRVSVAFHGHAHNGTYEGKTLTGVPVFNVSYPIMQRRSPEQPYAVVEL